MFLTENPGKGKFHKTETFDILLDQIWENEWLNGVFTGPEMYKEPGKTKKLNPIILERSFTDNSSTSWFDGWDALKFPSHGMSRPVGNGYDS